MATVLPPDFKEFLRLLNSRCVRYLLIGGYAINYYGYSRNTEDLDVWIAIAPDNAEHTAEALRDFGFVSAEASTFLKPNWVVRMGVPPMRIEVLTTISGVHFEDCYDRRDCVDFDGLPVTVISRADLLKNKRASGRPKDLVDVDRLDPQ